ncbi:hypothetical protein GCM10010222_80030 [Streptomyces tanashiensis]|nr:hypothetical protein GCM10010222_80030 [Streptomyces tanashiensis]
MGVQAVEHPSHQGTSARGGDAVVEVCVVIEEGLAGPAAAVVAGIPHRGEALGQRGELGLGDPAGRLPRCCRLEDHAHLEQFIELHGAQQWGRRVAREGAPDEQSVCLRVEVGRRRERFRSRLFCLDDKA